MQVENRQEEQQWMNVVVAVCFDVGACSLPQKAKSHLVVSGLAELKEQQLKAPSEASCWCFMYSKTQAALTATVKHNSFRRSPESKGARWLNSSSHDFQIYCTLCQPKLFHSKTNTLLLFLVPIQHGGSSARIFALMLIPIITSRPKVHSNCFQVLEAKDLNYWEYKAPKNGKKPMNLKADLGDRTWDGHWGNWDAMSASHNSYIISSESYKLNGVLISSLSSEGNIFLHDRVEIC